MNKIIMQLIDDREKAKKIVSNAEYITWLGNFTRENVSFSDDKWLYFPEKLSVQDNKFVQELHLLYDGIEMYAQHNYIYPTECDFGGFYRIKYDGIGYEISRLIGQGTVFFCTRVEIENEQEFIDFNDIMNNKVRDNVKEIKAKLEHLSEVVTSVFQAGVPYDAICETLNHVLKEMQSKKE